VPLAGHECEEITTVYFNNEALTLDGSGNVTAPSQYVGYARVKKHLGSSTQTADADLVSESARWTTNHRGRGVCYVYVRLKWSAEVYPSGWPNVSALVKGKLVYDSRTATTAWSANWALCLADYLTDTRLGLGTDLADIDDTALQVAANISDESVTLNPSGTEARYTCNGQIGSDNTPGDVIDQIVRAGAGFCGYIGGKWVIHAGAYRTPTIGLDENDIRAPLSVQTKLSRAENFNAAKGVFTSPDNEWQPTDYPPITNATYETQDDGVRIYQNFEWPFTTSNATAQRLSKIALERVRQPIIVNLPCKLTAMQVQAGDNVELTISRMGWTSKVFEVVSATFALDQQGSGPALGYDLVLRETASGVWDWNNGEETEIDLAPNTNLPDPRTVAAPTSLLLESSSSEIFTQVDGTVIPRIKATWTLPADTFVQSGGYIRTEFKRTADTEWIPWTLVRGDVEEEYFTDAESGINYSIRIRAENTLRASSDWVSDTITVGQKTSAPGVVTGITMVAGNASGYDGPAQYFFGSLTYAAVINFVPPSDSDISYYEYVITDVDTDADADSTPAQVTHDPRIEYNHGNRGISQPWYLRIRSVDRSGNAGSWAALGSDIRNFIGFAAGTLSEQDSDDVAVTAIETGQGSNVQQVLARFPVTQVVSLTGGSPTETISVSLTNRGLSTKPDVGFVECSTDPNIQASYDFDNALNSSTVAYIDLETMDGANLPAGLQRFSIEFIEYL
jgi:hypothetical protein